MSYPINRAESWQCIYQASKVINFSSFDYDSVKQSLVDYFKIYHPEFNNWIETDEFVMILEAFAYVAELYSYRLDMVAHENFLATAQRPDSVIKLAKFISYAPSRNTGGSGLVKIIAIKTTESIYDSDGNNLSNVKINWSDSTNNNWKSQFMSVMNRVISGSFGITNSADRSKVQNVLYESYSINNNAVKNGVITYSITIGNLTLPMELVSSHITQLGAVENRPAVDNKFNFIYKSDGTGDQSNNTGFFILTKQGILHKSKYEFTAAQANSSITVNVNNINNTDIWVNNVDADGKILQSSADVDVRLGEWFGVKSTYDIIDNLNTFNKYTVETLENDKVRIVFGDGTFSNMPKGLFDIWYRTSINDNITITNKHIDSVDVVMSYIDDYNNTQQLTVTFSLLDPITNITKSEDIEHIRQYAPYVYYTQNRMVNHVDYNSYIAQDSSVIKLKAINRSYAGQSQFAGWYDNSNTYTNTLHYGNDLAVFYLDNLNSVVVPNDVSAATVIVNYVEPLLSNSSIRLLLGPQYNKKYFNDTELHDIVFKNLGEALEPNDTAPPAPKLPLYLKFDNASNSWKAGDSSDSWIIKVDKQKQANITSWKVVYQERFLCCHSTSIKFWDYTRRTINDDTKNSVFDNITILKNNTGSVRNDVRTKSLTHDISLKVLGNAVKYNNTPSTGTPDINTLIVSTLETGSAYDDIALNCLINHSHVIDTSNKNSLTVTFNEPFIYNSGGISDIKVFPVLDINGTIGSKGVDLKAVKFTTSLSNSQNVIINSYIADTITIEVTPGQPFVAIVVTDYIYLKHQTLMPANITTLLQYLAQDVGVIRINGRSGINFAYKHYPDYNNLINPNTTNIIDIFMITQSYYNSVLSWLRGDNNTPIQETPTQLLQQYAPLLVNKMISDTVVLKSGSFKIIFGKKAIIELQANFVITKSSTTTMTDNQIKFEISKSINEFFNINYWGFGESFNFTELAAYCHNKLGFNINSMVIVPVYENNFFGDLFQINVMEHEVLIPHIDNNIIVVSSLTNNLMKMR
jgi:hypothetical protein